jgi:hypothetical protein
LGSCHFFNEKTVKGDGNVVKQDRNINGFSSVHVSGGIHVMITESPAAGVQVETDANLQEYIEVEKRGDVLSISQKRNTSLNATGRITVFVSAPVFRELHASGACKIASTGRINYDSELGIDLTGASEANLDVKTPAIRVNASGASSAILSGETKDLILDGSGACTFRVTGLLAENADVELSGASSADVFASVTLKVNASGASHVKYKGNATVTQDVSGASGVQKIAD